MTASGTSILQGITSMSQGGGRPVTANRTSASQGSTSVSQGSTSMSQGGGRPMTANRTSVSRCMMVSKRRSITSQFRKSAVDRRRTVNLPAVATRSKSAPHNSRPNDARVKTTNHTSNPLTSHGHTQLNSAQMSSCHDRRKLYQAELNARQKASKNPAPRHRNVASSASSKMSPTPSNFRHSVATVTSSSVSHVPRRKTVSFVTPASHKSTPHLHRSQPVKKEMSMRYVLAVCPHMHM